MAALQRFMDGVRMYRTEIIQYVRSKTADFSSASFFSTCTEHEMAQYKDFAVQEQQAQNQAEKTRLWQAGRAWSKALADPPNLDLQDCPRFTTVPGALRNLRNAIPDLALLIVANILFFAIAFVAFVRYDVR